ncbi:MAG: DNA methyltransferase [Candidatus Helarchaeota archaeon]
MKSVKLVWQGKSLPKMREVNFKLLELFKVKNSEKSTDNMLFFGENEDVLMYLINNLKEKIDLIYIDPPFATGETFKHKVKISDGSWTIVDNFVEKKAYDDTWGKNIDVYLQMLYERLCLMKKLLSKSGSIFVHVDWRISAHVKLIMEEIFGSNNFLNEIIWNYVTPGYPRDRFAKKHDTIFWFRASDKHVFNLDDVRTPYDKERKKKATKDEDGNLVYVHGPGFGVTKLHPKGRITDDVWKIPLVNSMARERTTYPTQKPLELVERIIKAASNPGDLIADFFMGSGTTCVAAEKLNRRWIGVDNSFFAINTVKKRLIENNFPFTLYARNNFNALRSNDEGVSWNFETRMNGNSIQIIFHEYQNKRIIQALKEKKIDLNLPSDLINYWAVDFNFHGIFKIVWSSYKLRNKKDLHLSCSHTYKSRGKKRIKIQVIDIFNNYFEDEFSILIK